MTGQINRKILMNKGGTKFVEHDSRFHKKACPANFSLRRSGWCMVALQWVSGV